MPYRYLEETVKPREIVFEVWGASREEMFLAACDATMNVFLDDLEDIGVAERKTFRLVEISLEFLLAELLEEILFCKEAQDMLFRMVTLHIRRQDKHWVLSGNAYGERFHPERHSVRAFVRKVDRESFRIEKTCKGWKATIGLLLENEKR